MTGKTAADIAGELVTLYHSQFANKKNGKYRVSRKFFRTICERRRLPDSFIDQIADEVFELGYLLVDVESFYVVFNQQLFRSYRRVTELAIAALPDQVAPPHPADFNGSVPNDEDELTVQ